MCAVFVHPAELFDDDVWSELFPIALFHQCEFRATKHGMATCARMTRCHVAVPAQQRALLSLFIGNADKTEHYLCIALRAAFALSSLGSHFRYFTKPFSARQLPSRNTFGKALNQQLAWFKMKHSLFKCTFSWDFFSDQCFLYMFVLMDECFWYVLGILSNYDLLFVFPYPSLCLFDSFHLNFHEFSMKETFLYATIQGVFFSGKSGFSKQSVLGQLLARGPCIEFFRDRFLISMIFYGEERDERVTKCLGGMTNVYILSIFKRKQNREQTAW